MDDRRVTLSSATLDRITIEGLRDWRESISGSVATHPEDLAADAMRLAAIDVLLAYNGASKPED